MSMAEKIACRRIRFRLGLLLCVSLFLNGAAVAQKDKKKKKDAAASDSVSSLVPQPDEQAIDFAISEMLGAWQIGDTERLHKHYADDVSVVSGAWEPPVLGWANFLASYQNLHARMQQIRKDRENTLVRVRGDLGWACFQWNFSGLLDGQPTAARGQTTLILQKRSGNWVIVHDHTSLVQMSQSPSPNNTPPQTAPPAKPPSF